LPYTLSASRRCSFFARFDCEGGAASDWTDLRPAEPASRQHRSPPPGQPARQSAGMRADVRFRSQRGRDFGPAPGQRLTRNGHGATAYPISFVGADEQGRRNRDGKCAIGRKTDDEPKRCQFPADHLARRRVGCDRHSMAFACHILPIWAVGKQAALAHLIAGIGQLRDACLNRGNSCFEDTLQPPTSPPACRERPSLFSFGTRCKNSTASRLTPR
jgi:hypothetical protein